MDTSLERIKRWGVKGGLTVLDQGIFSGTSFVVTVMLARWLDAEQFGAFAVGLSILVFFLQIHTSILLEPMAVVGPSSYRELLQNYLAMQIRLHFYLTVPAGLVLVLLVASLKWFGVSKIANLALISVGLWLPLLLLPWLTRRVFYVLARPGFALLGSFIYAILAIGGILYGEKNQLLNAEFGVLALACAGLVSSLILIAILIRLTDRDIKISASYVLIQNWRFGKWLVLSGFLIALSGQAPIFLSSALLGLRQAGAMRAINTLIQPMILATTAITALVTSNLAYEHVGGDLKSFNRKARLISLVMISFSILFELILVLFWSPIEEIVYRGKFREYAPMLPYWGLVALVLAGTSGMQASFQASGRPQGLLIGAAIWTPVCFGFGFWFTNSWGLWGLTASTLIGYLALAATFACLYLRWFYLVPVDGV